MDGDGLSAHGFDLQDDLFRSGGRSDVVDGNIGAARSKVKRDAFTNATRRSGDSHIV